MDNKQPTQAYIREALDYDPTTGVLTWRERPRHQFRTEVSMRRWNARFAGTEAGSVARGECTCYRVVSLQGRQLMAHRLAWMHVHGEWPEIIDHCDRDGLNNRLANLRSVDAVGNSRNRRKQGSQTGVCGVFLQGRGANKPYVAHIGLEGRQVFLGTFETIELAAAARQGAERALGFHPNHGRDLGGAV